MEVVKPHSDLEVLGDSGHQGQFRQEQQQQHQQQHEHDQPPAETDSPGQIELPPNKARRGWLIPSAIAAVIAVVVVGGVVGGGLGASLANCHNDLSQLQSPTATADSPPTTTNTPGPPTTTDGLLTNYQVEVPTAVYNLSVSCADLPMTMQTAQNEKFSVRCNRDFGNGAAEDATGDATVLADIVGIVAYNVTDCLEACSSYTLFSGRWGWGQTCRSVTFKTTLRTSFNDLYANCWLKNGTRAIVPGPGNCDVCISASKTQ